MNTGKWKIYSWSSMQGYAKKEWWLGFRNFTNWGGFRKRH